MFRTKLREGVRRKTQTDDHEHMLGAPGNKTVGFELIDTVPVLQERARRI
jgi:hypothetical protein